MKEKGRLYPLPEEALEYKVIKALSSSRKGMPLFLCHDVYFRLKFAKIRSFYISCLRQP